MKHIVLHWPRLGPYHLARLRGAHEIFSARGVTVTALEIAGMDRTYGWKKEEQPTVFERRTVFPNRYYEDLRDTELKTAVFGALDELLPDAVAINGYAFKDSRVCLDWCASRRRKAILMSETTAADATRFVVREAAKRMLLKRFSAAICGGSRHRDYLLKLGVPPHRVFMKYDVVDNSFFQRKDNRGRTSLPGLDSSEPFFLASSRFIARKNLDRLLTAFVQYRSQGSDGWRLILLGNGEEEQRLRNRVTEERITGVTFAGFRQIQEIREYYHAASCFVHPALIEPWGLVVNEAMAAGLPVIVSRAVGCAPDLVEEGGNGFLFDPRNSSALAARLSDMSRNAGLRQIMSSRSREIISNWTVEHFARNLWRAFEVPDQAYRMVYYGSRKVVAYPDLRTRKKLERLRTVEPHTIRRRVADAIVRGCVACRLDKFLFRKRTLDDPTLLAPGTLEALHEIRAQLGLTNIKYTLSWPVEQTRNRTYAHVFDEAANPIAFVKLAPANEMPTLKNGFNTLRALSPGMNGKIRVPKPLLFGSVDDVCFHVAECVPRDPGGSQLRLEDISPADCIESFAGPNIKLSATELTRLDWMKRFWRLMDPNHSFARWIEEDQRFDLTCHRVHGDLTMANLILSRDHVWIIDWELSDPCGPALTDYVSFFLGNRQRQLNRRPDRVLQEFRKMFIDSRCIESQRAARLALAFLHSVQSGPGQTLVSAWNAAGL